MIIAQNCPKTAISSWQCPFKLQLSFSWNWIRVNLNFRHALLFFFTQTFNQTKFLCLHTNSIVAFIFFRCRLCKWVETPIPASQNSSKQHWRCVRWCSLLPEVCPWWHPGWTIQHLSETQYRWSCYLSLLAVWRVAFVFTGEWTSPINEVKSKVITSIM